MRLVPATALFLSWLAVSTSASAADPFRLYFVDVEGGQATLLVSPSGESLLIDTGYEGFGGRDAVRIRDAAKDAGVKRIDHLLITHFHADHFGGITNLLAAMPVAEFLDHGPSIENNAYPEPYAAAFAKGKHAVVKPGDKIPMKGVDITVVAAAGANIAPPGQPNAHCAGLARKDGETGENPQSVGIVAQFGSFRFADLGDLTWNRELDLLCPANKIGRLDLYLATHHGAESPKAIWGLAPRVAVIGNGPRKGGAPAAYKLISTSPGIEAVWQLHFGMANGSEGNTADAYIANLAEAGDKGDHLKIEVEESGAFTVTNPRNKFTRRYERHE